MCDKTNAIALRNGHAGDPVTQGHAIADIVDLVDDLNKAVAGISAQLKDIPTRKEMLSIVEESLSIHIQTCAHARKTNEKPPKQKPSKPSRFKLWKGGLEAEGAGGVILGLGLGIILTVFTIFAGPYIASWIEAIKGLVTR